MCLTRAGRNDPRGASLRGMTLCLGASPALDVVASDLPVPNPLPFPLPLQWVIQGHSAVFWGLPLRRENARETPENLTPTSGGPNGICHLVGQYLRFPVRGTAIRP